MALGGSAAAQTRPDWSQLDPHGPEAEAAAREALSRKRVLPIRGRVLALKGVASATSGRVTSLADIAAGLSSRYPGLVASVSETGLRLNVRDEVLFDFDKAELRPGAEPVLGAIADAARRAGERPVRVEGHTDARGADAYNQRLSEQRAAAVERWLLANGVPDARLSAQGFGRSRPVAPNNMPDGRDNPEGRQKNRRVEIVIGG